MLYHVSNCALRICNKYSKRQRRNNILCKLISLKFSANLDLSRHGLSADSVVSVDIVSHEGNVIPLQQKVKGRVLLNAMIPGRGIVMYHIKPH